METTNTEALQLGIEAERERVRQIDGVVQQFPYLRSLADAAVRDGTDIESFNQRALGAMSARAQMIDPGNFNGQMPATQLDGGSSFQASRITGRKLDAFRGASRQEREENAYRAGMWVQATLLGNERAKRWIGDNMQRVMTTTSASKGAALVPVEMSDAIISLREEYGVARQELRVVPMGSDHLVIPRRAGGLTTYFIGETSQITESDASWNDVNLVARKLGVLTRMSTDLAEDAVIDLALWLSDEIAYAFAEKEDDCLFNGDGTSTYGGIQGVRNKLAGTAGAILAASGVDTFSEITANDLLSLTSVLPQYAQKSAKWYCSQPCYQLVFQALAMAAGGATMMETGNVQLKSFGGYPIVISQKMPTSTGDLSGQIMLLFGDLSQAGTLGDRRMITVKVDESRYLEFDQIAVQGTERFDIVVHDAGDAVTAGPIVGLVGN